ncbi:hypothetical protein Agabi119p4_9115 [Agaricus bisporus var. burnettii]|uniref:Uncharacterized protein n=1 Tax=Agaricus bisporus var. burnettii TaxID=192524 RepID=A0A8H7EY26_AGABI|nr:hypothetical protein Agabi119p4_9115 [Agaricus bisporus var. burnettii]
MSTVSVQQFRQLASILPPDQLVSFVISPAELDALPFPDPSVSSAGLSLVDRLIRKQQFALIQRRFEASEDVPLPPVSSISAPSLGSLPSISVASSTAMEVEPTGFPAVSPIGGPPTSTFSGTPSAASTGPFATTLPLPRVPSQEPPAYEVQAPGPSNKRRHGNSQSPHSRNRSVPRPYRDPTPETVEAQEMIDLTQDNPEADPTFNPDGEETGEKTKREKPRREADLVATTSLSLGGDPFASILDLFAFPTVSDSSTACINCAASFYPTCTHRGKFAFNLPLPCDQPEAVKTTGRIIKNMPCDRCKKGKASHCDHAKAPCISQFLAESLQPLSFLAGSNLKSRMRDVTLSVVQAKASRAADQLCQSRARTAIFELARDLTRSEKYIYREPAYWVQGGFFPDEETCLEVFKAARTISGFHYPAKAVNDNDRLALQLFSSYCSVAEWIGELEPSWTWYASNDEGKTELPTALDFQERHEEAQVQYAADLEASRAGSPSPSKRSVKGKGKAPAEPSG